MSLCQCQLCLLKAEWSHHLLLSLPRPGNTEQKKFLCIFGHKQNTWRPLNPVTCCWDILSHSQTCCCVTYQCCYVSLGCRTLTLQDTLLHRTAPTSAALPARFLLTRQRASPWRALTTWVGTHELLQHSDLTSQQLAVPMAVPFTCSSSHLHHPNPPHSLPESDLGVGYRGR